MAAAGEPPEKPRRTATAIRNLFITKNFLKRYGVMALPDDKSEPGAAQRPAPDTIRSFPAADVNSRFSHAPLRINHLPVRLPAVSGATADRQADPALVRRRSLGLDHLPAVFPKRAAGRLCLCRCLGALAAPAPAGLCPCGLDAAVTGAATHSGQQQLEAQWQ